MTLSERLNGSATERVFQAPNDLSVSLRVLKCPLCQVATLNLTISDEILKSRAKNLDLCERARHVQDARPVHLNGEF